MSTDAVPGRLRWRCRRGMLELDVALERFLERHYAGLGPAERAAFERLLGASDADLLGYLHGQATPADQELRNLVKKIF